MGDCSNIAAMRKSGGSRYKQVIVTLDSEAQHKLLKRCAQAWADEIADQTGATIGQPVSAYVRALLKQDADRRGIK